MKQKINRNWQFRRTDDGNTQWRQLDLPHDWAIEGDFSASNYIHSIQVEKHLEFRHDSYLPRGCGEYQKHLSLPEKFPGQQLILEFDGVFGESVLFVDGKKAGENNSGYTGALYDITGFASGKESIELKMSVSADRMQGWWYEGAGIYRHVWLHNKPECYITPWGVSITTPEISSTSATVDMAIEVCNAGNNEQSGTLSINILSPDGRNAASKNVDFVSAAGETGTVKTSIAISDPELWDVNDPNLYQAEITLQSSAGKDEAGTAFGIRSFKFTPDDGFYLNGRKLQLRGGNIHHDFGGLGTALPDRAHEKNVEVLKQMGANIIRSAHNPAAPALMDACDRLGMLFWAETRNLYPDNGGKKDLTALILRDRNHPSVILWSLANTAGASGGERYLTDNLQVLHDLAKQLDPSRPTAVGLEGNADANANGFAMVTDVVGYNGGGMAGKDDRDHQNYPERVTVISEYASGRGARGIYHMDTDDSEMEVLGDGRIITRNNSYSTEFDLLRAHIIEWDHVMTRPHLAGGLMWSAIEYRGETSGYPVVTSQFGVLDICRFPKETYYYYQQLWTGKPMIHIFPPWNHRLPEGTPVDVCGFSNCDSIALFLNGSPLDDKDILQEESVHCRKWQIPYIPGELVAEGMINGQTVCRQVLNTPAEPAAIRISTDRSTISADGEDIAFLRADVIDHNGNFVPDAAIDLSIEVTGCGSLAGVCSGDPISHEKEKASTIKTFSGSALIIVRAADTAGEIRVKISAEKIAGQQITLTSAAK